MWGPVGVEVVGGLDRRDAGSGVGAGMGDEAGTAILDPGRPMHHFVGREAHLFSRETTKVEEERGRVLGFRVFEMGESVL